MPEDQPANTGQAIQAQAEIQADCGSHGHGAQRLAVQYGRGQRGKQGETGQRRGRGQPGGRAAELRGNAATATAKMKGRASSRIRLGIMQGIRDSRAGHAV